jgi:hypothetical protein
VQSLVNERDEQGRPRFDLATKGGMDAAYDYAVDSYVAKYGEQVLATPRSSFSWILPSMAVVGGLGLLFFAGRRIVSRGQPTAAGKAEGAAAAPVPTDDKYTDKLDDELADTD